MASSAVDDGLNLPGGKIIFIIQTDIRDCGGTHLSHLYGQKYFKASIQAAIKEVFCGDGQEPQISVRPLDEGSLHVELNLATGKRFDEVVEEYESRQIADRLQRELLEYKVKVEGLNVEIENMEEVKKTRDDIGRYKRSRIIVQGGTYKKTPSGKTEKEYIKATIESAKKGYAKLMQGGTAVEAVEAAVRVLEDDERFNAGYGSVLNEEGKVECDAMIMDGHTLESGAVISGRHFRNPVSLAKEIMENSKHCALSGEGALEFAKTLLNFPFCYPEQLISKWYKNVKRADQSCSDYPDMLEDVPHEEVGHKAQGGGSDTVSAVAMDADGHLACAMSTGGLREKLKGRVGDVPMVGCGGYANETGAATAAGRGESIIKIILAKKVVDNMERETDAQRCVEDGLKDMEQRAKGKGGLIAIDKDGNFGKCCSTDVIMVWASIKDDEMKHGIEADRAAANVNST